ncbi:Receptor like protein 21 [Cardamine amara subsp. amara]|uniref:Receptor like protein 21 n=1 Tax=Cardamine amara subsp. amara TaxID=228776 RepID=A0ABD1ALL2_CARAN
MERKRCLGHYLIWVILFLGQLKGCKTCIEKERKALLELKKYLISKSSESVLKARTGELHNMDVLIPTWTNDTKSDCCRWDGIKCNLTSRRVIKLSIGQMYFKESSLLNLSLLHPFEELQILNLSEGRDTNSFSFKGFFDDVEGYKSLRKLKYLEILDLSSNGFPNDIFPFLEAVESLTTLNLRNNFMSFSSKEQENLTRNLEFRHLSNGSIRVLTHLKNLKALDLSFNIFSSSMILQDLKNLTNLEVLGLAGNYHDGPMQIEVLTNLKNLKALDLSSNEFSSSMILQGKHGFFYTGNGYEYSLFVFPHDHFVKYNPLAFTSDLKNLTNLEVLGLADNYLDGPMLIEVVCEMKNLRELDLRGNDFVGELPLCFGSLNKLRVLDLSSNRFIGNLPSTFNSLEPLEYLSLLDNNFTGLFSLNPLTNLTKLKVLKLSSTSDMLKVDTESNWQPKFQLGVVLLRSCGLEKIPSFLVYQKNLHLVDLSNNRLSGEIPTWLLANNTELKVLQLQNNLFTTFQMPTTVHNLQVLDVSANHIGGMFPNNIGRALSNMVDMNGSYNGFQGELPSSMGEMKIISFLDLSFNNFSGKLPTSFLTGCISLNYLTLSHNKFTGHFLPRRTSFTSLRILRIDNNLFTGKIRVGLLSSTKLSFLDMSNNRLTEGTIPPSLVDLNFLSRLDLSGNLLSGALPSRMAVDYLFLHNNSFTGPIPETLLKGVSILSLWNNKLSGNIPQFVNTQDIRILLLRGNNLTRYIPRQLCELSNIEVLDLSYNKLNGSIPSCLFNLSFGVEEDKLDGLLYGETFELEHFKLEFYKFTFVVEELMLESYTKKETEINFAAKQRYESYYGGRFMFTKGILDYMYGMDLSSNELSGVIPTELGNLPKVKVLNLSHNFLSSSIPSSFSNLKDIESLDLSYNMLNGSIPYQLTSLTSLEVFDVSHNNLSGIIPQGRQFNTFSESSYLGNPLLCGPPANINCEAKKSSEEANNREDDEDEDEAAIDMLVFYFSTASTYVTSLIGILVLLCFECRWRRAWLHIVDVFIASAKKILP